ncbi:serine kinase [Neobacillus drentensis]|uniref:serine kinase n=1 Tax=Neobacillus drentensis TaxID=220684 RepID=UPI001F22DDBA|nr:serine kinase [Neobacillus drentensis]ULT59456.1 serine kinase [Neobacillus drentensis]
MKLGFPILLILLGSFLIGFTVDRFGKTGNVIMHLIGIGLYLGAIFMVRSKPESQKS